MQLSARYNNVQIVSTGAANVSGHPAQLVNVQYSVGTPAGEQWARAYSDGGYYTRCRVDGNLWSLGQNCPGCPAWLFLRSSSWSISDTLEK